MLIKSTLRDRRSEKIEGSEISLKTSENLKYSNYPWESSRIKQPSILALRTAAQSDNWSWVTSLLEGFSWFKSQTFVARASFSLGEFWLADSYSVPFPLAYAAYFLAACILDFQRALALFILTCLVLLVLVHCFLKRFFGKNLTTCLKPFKNSCLKLWMKW